MHKVKWKLFLLVTCALCLLNCETRAQSSPLRGLRVDTAYLYALYPGLTAAQVSKQVVTQSKASGVNTLFVYAYNSVYGALYPTTYPLTTVEGGYGKLNILKELTATARLNGMKVVAVVPVNNFKTVWESQPGWRAKNKSGADYVPLANTHLLSAWHPDFRIWLEGFYQDLLNRNPDIDGIEAVEPTVDYYWAKESDYNSVATEKFLVKFPGAQLGDQNWLNFRAQGMTDLIRILVSAAGAAKKNSYLVQTWPAKPDGSLFSSQVIKDNIGLDLDGILNLTGKYKLTYLMAELMWQQWAAEHGPTNFPVSWTTQAAQTFIQYVGTKSIPLLHVEMSLFGGLSSNVTPTLAEFRDTLLAIKNLDAGIDVYDYNQVVTKKAWAELSAWGRPLSELSKPRRKR